MTIKSREASSDADGAIQVFQLNLVDLAGSEQAGQTGATGYRFKEESFASRAKSIKNKPQINEVISDAALIKQYRKQIEQLTAELEKERKKNRTKESKLQDKDENIEDIKETTELQEIQDEKTTSDHPSKMALEVPSTAATESRIVTPEKMRSKYRIDGK